MSDLSTPALYVLLCLTQPQQVYTPVQNEMWHITQEKCEARREVFEVEQPERWHQCRCQVFKEVCHPLGGLPDKQSTGGLLTTPSKRNDGVGAPRSVSPN
jgi:hypothetical protein